MVGRALAEEVEVVLVMSEMAVAEVEVEVLSRRTGPTDEASGLLSSRDRRFQGCESHSNGPDRRKRIWYKQGRELPAIVMRNTSFS